MQHHLHQNAANDNVLELFDLLDGLSYEAALMRLRCIKCILFGQVLGLIVFNRLKPIYNTQCMVQWPLVEFQSIIT